MVLAVAAGGACGAVARYLVMVQAARWFGVDFPWGTLAVNVVGSFLMGVLISAATHSLAVSNEMRALLAVGFLGSFTTFSTFSLDTVAMFERGAVIAAGAYVAASVIIAIAAFVAGDQLWRSLAA
jgi:CrcB protein